MGKLRQAGRRTSGAALRTSAWACALAACLAAVAATAWGDDRAGAVAILEALDREEGRAGAAAGGPGAPPVASANLPAKAPDTPHASATAAAVAQARAALERGTRMRTAGDEAHARLADGLALEWALTARDLARATAAEREARTVRTLALDAGARAERERALLEEGIARTGRLRAELAAADGRAEEPQTRTSTLPPRVGIDGGARRASGDALDGGAP